MTGGPPAHVTDRLEQALEHRADVAGEIARGEQAEPSTRRGLARTAIWVGVTGVSLYLVAPALIDSLSSLPELETIRPGWLAGMAVLQAGSIVCLWVLQRIAMRGGSWHAIAYSQLAGNAMAKIAPGGGAVGAALQYRMLVQAGLARARAVSGLAASNLLTLAIVLALPVLALPALISGAAGRDLARAGIAALVVFVVLFGIGAWLLASDAPLRRIGSLVQRARNRMRRHAVPARGLPDRLLAERDRIAGAVGARWKAALASGVGRWVLDYASLLAALLAVGAQPRPSLVLLAFCTAQLLAQIPITPGGLGFVEAGLTATLGLAGVSAADAVLATLTYRLFTYWLPLPLGLGAGVLHRRRYGGEAGTTSEGAAAPSLPAAPGGTLDAPNDKELP